MASKNESVEKNIEREEVNERLKCILSDDEKMEVADALTKKMTEREIKQEELDSIKKQLNGEISTLDNEIKNAQRLFYDGYEYRAIACQVERDYNSKTFTLTRLDTGEVVEQRRLLREKQLREAEMANA